MYVIYVAIRSAQVVVHKCACTSRPVSPGKQQVVVIPAQSDSGVTDRGHCARQNRPPRVMKAALTIYLILFQLE